MKNILKGEQPVHVLRKSLLNMEKSVLGLPNKPARDMQQCPQVIQYFKEDDGISAQKSKSGHITVQYPCRRVFQ